ncbi:MAG: ABC transporter permease [Chloroflexota bacterium]
MLAFILRRVLMLIPILFLISVVSYALIELPPGDWVTYYIENLRTSGVTLNDEEAERITQMYGFDRPAYARYLRWMEGIIFRQDFGYSFQWNRTVNELLSERLPLTIAMSFGALIISWVIAIPIGIYSATHQYSIPDYVFTTLGFIGLATPQFTLAMILAWILFRYFGFSSLGLYSADFAGEPWSFAKFIDLLKHLILPLLMLGLAGTGITIRVMRNNLLDELKKQYVVTARAKGVKEGRLLWRYPVRMAINPIISTVGWVLPGIFGGDVLVSLILGLPTIGPLLFGAVLGQDMFLAGSIVMILSFLTIIGTLLSDIALAWVDPRIRFEGASK